MKIFNKSFIYIIKLYQLLISPFLGNNCRYQPTCSVYFIECLEKYHLGHGLYLGIKRLLNCHPFSGSGYDPVP
tara:strand:+ start:77 stop:295 length:219 start_codon:yes stop_codon:yes gene_type:complete